MAEGKDSTLTHVQMVLSGVIQDLLAQPWERQAGGKEQREEERKKRDEQTGSRIHVTAFANGRTVLSTIFSSEGERHRKKKKKNPDCAIPKATWKTSTF